MHTYQVRVPVGEPLDDATLKSVEESAGCNLHITDIRADGKDFDMYTLECADA